MPLEPYKIPEGIEFILLYYPLSDVVKGPENYIVPIRPYLTGILDESKLGLNGRLRINKDNKKIYIWLGLWEYHVITKRRYNEIKSDIPEPKNISPKKLITCEVLIADPR